MYSIFATADTLACKAWSLENTQGRNAFGNNTSVRRRIAAYVCNVFGIPEKMSPLAAPSGIPHTYAAFSNVGNQRIVHV